MDALAASVSAVYGVPHLGVAAARAQTHLVRPRCLFQSNVSWTNPVHGLRRVGVRLISVSGGGGGGGEAGSDEGAAGGGGGGDGGGEGGGGGVGEVVNAVADAATVAPAAVASSAAATASQLVATLFPEIPADARLPDEPGDDGSVPVSMEVDPPPPEYTEEDAAQAEEPMQQQQQQQSRQQPASTPRRPSPSQVYPGLVPDEYSAENLWALKRADDPNYGPIIEHLLDHYETTLGLENANTEHRMQLAKNTIIMELESGNATRKSHIVMALRGLLAIRKVTGKEVPLGRNWIKDTIWNAWAKEHGQRWKMTDGYKEHDYL